MPEIPTNLGYPLPSSGVILITGTDTGVGKTVVSAAVAATLLSKGVDVHIHKPVQTGLISPCDPRRAVLGREYSDVVTRGDAQLAGELAGCPYSTGVAFQLPLAPTAAAAEFGEPLPTASQHAVRIHTLLQHHEIVIVEGAGGLLVDLGEHTLADIAQKLHHDFQVPVHNIVVVRSQLGTLNHTALTVEALARRDLAHINVVVGSWPAHPAAVEVSNLEQLAQTYPVLGVIPQDSTSMTPACFQARAVTWLSPKAMV